MTERRRSALGALAVADPPERWRALGFAVAADGRCSLGGVTVQLGVPGLGLTGWWVDGIDGNGAIDGLAAIAAPPPGPGAPAGGRRVHPNGVSGLDHVVVRTPELDRTAAALAQAGIPLRRVVPLRGTRIGFRRLGEAILEVVEDPGEPPGAPARLWGLVAAVADIDALAGRLGAVMGEVRAAVQPGRRIATLSDAAGLSTAVAFLTPEPPGASAGGPAPPS